MSMRSMGKTCEKTCILYCKASQRDAKEILSPGSLIKNHYHGKCFNLQLHLAANNKKITIFFSCARKSEGRQ